MSESVFEYLHQTKEKIDAHIADFLPDSHDHPDIDHFYKMMRDYPLRSGKRLRPTLCLLMCEAFGGDPKNALTTATALELLQSWLLIHDDIEDASLLRRSEPCLHIQHGIPMAINVGDGLHCKMWEMLSRNFTQLGYQIGFQILSEFIQLSNRTVEGQHLELSWVKDHRWSIAEIDYWLMCVQKTAWYTCITPCRLGALIGGATHDQMIHFIEIGENLGVAFQIQDDVLNLISDEGTYGKEIAGDISEGKRTIPLIHLFKSCTPKEAKQITQIMDKPRDEKSSSEILEILSMMQKYGSINYAQERSRTLAQKAKQEFDKNFQDLPGENAVQIFRKLIDFAIERDY